MCYANDLFETFCCLLYEINKLFNRIISKYKLRCIPHQWHRTDISFILAHVSQICCATQRVGTWIYTFSVFSRLVLSHFEIVKHECDLFCIYNLLFGLILALMCNFFLYRRTTRTFPRILGNDFTSNMKQKWFEDRSNRQVLQYAVLHSCLDFDFMNRPQLLQIFTFANAYRRLFVVSAQWRSKHEVS